MRGSAIPKPINQAEGFASYAVRLLETGLQVIWQGCRLIGWRIARQRTRRTLAQLDDRMLNDVGITREQALREVEKPFWIA